MQLRRSKIWPLRGAPSTAAQVTQIRQGAVKRVEEVKATSADNKTVVNFVIFKEVPFQQDGISVVHVGARYNSEADIRPVFQWCYVKTEMKQGSASSRYIQLATLDNDRRKNAEIRAQDATEFGTSVNALRRAQQKCEFEN